jgi:hypothetical protein
MVPIEIKQCATCGDELHPERAEKYDHCAKPECRRRNARRLDVVAVGVNKAADQFVLFDEKTTEEAASGRYKKVPGTVGPIESHPRARDTVGRKPAPEVVPRSSARSVSRWSRAQENLALTYRDMGLTPDTIAKKLGISARLVTQILLAAPRRRH